MVYTCACGLYNDASVLPQEQEQMRLERIWAQQEKDRQVAEALANFATMQTGLRGVKGAVTHQTKPKSEETERNAEMKSGKKPTQTGTRKKTHAKVAVKKAHRKVAAAITG